MIWLLSVHRCVSHKTNGCNNVMDGLWNGLCIFCKHTNLDSYCAMSPESQLQGISKINSLNGTRCCVGSDCSIGLDLRKCIDVPTKVKEIVERKIKVAFIISDIDKECFGGDRSWLRLAKTENRKFCSNTVNLCRNVSCPENSHCVESDSNIWCRCDRGWHGYKCLRYGEFPYIKWLVSIGASTAFIISITKLLQVHSQMKFKRHMRTFGTQ